MTLLEDRINLKWAMKRGKANIEVTKKFDSYMKSYDEADKTVMDKIDHRDLFVDYMRYIGITTNENNDNE